MNSRLVPFFTGCLIFLMIIATIPVFMFTETKASDESVAPSNSSEGDSFKPTVTKPEWVDQDNNGVADTLDQEIAERIANGTAQDIVGVTVMLKSEPTAQDLADFVSSSGQVTTDLWTKATYGFGGKVSYEGVGAFAQKCPDLLLVEKEVAGEACVAYAAQQVGARTYVWNTLGLQGDPNSSIAVVDSGIDASHIDFSPGYGDQNFSKKIVGWKDVVNFTDTPFDDDGHGSHCAGLAAGNGFGLNSSGYASATWGTSIAASSIFTTYTWTGMMVNYSGIVTLSAKWLSTGTAKLSSLSLYKSGKSLTSWSQVSSVSTPQNDTWYSLTYNVASIPSGGYDTYDPRVDITAGNGSVYVVLNASWPYTPPSDGFSAWTGIAPQSKLVGVKTSPGTNKEFIDGINWIIANRMAYHITVASISLGFSSEKSAVDSAVLNLVNSGVTTVVSAGNEEAGSNYIYTPASVDEVITVAAMNQFDNIAEYSSQGGTSKTTGKTIKPDITAPGGSGTLGPALFSVDSNYNDAEGGFADVQANDAAPMQGTSMAAPVVSGCTQVVIQAMGGFAKWNYSRSQALQPKMLLLMTATETYPNLREGGSAFTSPTLGRGWKDEHEGYGRVNLDAAVDAVLKSYEVGSVVTDTLGKPPTTSDISVLGQRLAWARSVQLASGNTCNFSLSVPAGADYDVYLYNSTGTTYGDPALVAKSTTAVTGGTEQFYVTPTYTGTYYIVVKRATEDTGTGAFTLESSNSVGPVNVKINTPGILNASNVVHYSQNGVSLNGSISASKFSDYADIGTMFTIDNPISVSAAQRYKTTEPTTFAVRANITVELTYTRENMTLESPHPYPNSTDITWNLTRSGATSIRVHFNYIRTYSSDYIYISDNAGNPIARYSGLSTYRDFWSPWVPGDTIKIRLTSDSSYSNDGFVIDMTERESQPVNTDSNNFAATYKTEYLLAVNSPFGTTGGAGWYNNGTSVYATVTPLTVAGATGTQYVFTGWSGDASGVTSPSNAITMNGPKTATANWKTQYNLTVTSAYGTVGGAGWYDSGTSAYATVTPLAVDGATGTRYVFTAWSGDASGVTSPSNAITMDGPKTATANWKTQHQVSFAVTPQGTGSTSPAGTDVWVDAGAVSISATPSSGNKFSQWSSSSSGITIQNPTSPSTIANANGPGIITATFVAEPTVTPPPVTPPPVTPPPVTPPPVTPPPVTPPPVTPPPVTPPPVTPPPVTPPSAQRLSLPREVIYAAVGVIVIVIVVVAVVVLKKKAK